MNCPTPVDSGEEEHVPAQKNGLVERSYSSIVRVEADDPDKAPSFYTECHIEETDQCFTKFKKKMTCLMKAFVAFLNKSFYKLGGNVADYSGYYIIIPLLLSLLSGTGFQQMIYEDDPEYLFAPLNGEARYERLVAETYFEQNFTHDFHPSRVTRNGRFARIIVTAKDGSNLLDSRIWKDIMLADAMIQNITVEDEEEYLSFKDVCAIWDGDCWKNTVLDLDEFMPQIENGSMELTYPFMLDPKTFKMYAFPLYFGGVNVTEKSTIKSAKAATLYYWLKTKITKDDRRSAKWERALLKLFAETDFETIHVARFTSRTLETELENNTSSVVPYFGVTIFLMVTFCVVTLMMTDWVKTKPYLGVIGVISAGLAVLASFGMLMYLGVPFIGINMAAPFLMLGIGIDDTFVMLAAWRRTRIQDSVYRRMAQTYSDAAVSITITSITDMVSFYIGIYTPFPSVKIFCLYTGTAVIFTYFWHITFFGACLAVSGYAERSQRHGLFCFKVKSKSESEEKGCFYRYFCTGGISKVDPDNPADNRDHVMMLFFRDYLGRLLNIPAMKAFVIMVFALYLAGAMYGCTRVREGLERRKLSRYDSYSVDFYDKEDIYFREFPYRIQVILTGNITYSNPETQRKILELHDSFQNLSYVAGPLYTESWMKGWFDYLHRNGEYIDVNVSTEAGFIEALRDYYLSGEANEFALDVRFNEDYTRIIASRFIVQAYQIKDGNEDRDMMIGLRETAAQSEFNVTVHNAYFVFFDQFVMVRTISIQAIAMAAVVMIIVAIIFIPHPLCCVLVAFSIISIELGVIGYMSLWDVNLDSISMINLIMCIGFSVDFSAHISYAYLAAKVDTPEERVKDCLFALGMPIVQGGLSTIIGVVTLILAPSYIFITFFKTVFLVIFFGAMHGLFLLPVLLSLMGPGSCGSGKKSKEHHIYMDARGSRSRSATAPYDDPLQLPRLMSLTNHAVQNGGGGGGEKNGFYTAAYLSSSKAMPSKEDIANMEKDLGLGTSGEESSESSLSKGVVAKERKASNSNSRSKSKQLPIREVYSNMGYVSDDLDMSDSKKRNITYSEWENLRQNHNSVDYGTSNKTSDLQLARWSIPKSQRNLGRKSSSFSCYRDYEKY